MPNTKKVACHCCGHDSDVLASRPLSGGERVRYHHCPSCEAVWWTLTEKPKIIPGFVIKWSNQKPFAIDRKVLAAHNKAQKRKR